MKNIFTSRGVHKWIGLTGTFFILMFCLSGVILNHREMFGGCQVSRSLLPESYRIRNYNNAVVKGTLPAGNDSILLYGATGIWLADRQLKHVTDFNAGLPNGVDRRNVRGVVKQGNRLWCATQFGLYFHNGIEWEHLPLKDNNERLSDITLTPDSSRVIVLTRSAVYEIDSDAVNMPEAGIRTELKTPDGYKPRVSLFKTVWQLHSGELFGTLGRIAVDIIALITAFLCITGLILFLLPYRMRHSHSDPAGKSRGILRWNHVWHNKIGFYTLFFTILIALTGMCLRPPLMIPLALTGTPPVPGSNLDRENAWHDKLRGIRADSEGDAWLISTSDGFFTVSRDFMSVPVAVQNTPPVSPMGITVFEPDSDTGWLIGSFSGLYRWNRDNGSVTDYVTGEPYRRGNGRPVSGKPVSGFSRDIGGAGPTVFYYSEGAENLPPMNEVMSSQPMSLWNFALELHVGRCYSPVLGPLSELFIFVSGLFLTLILVTGLIINRRHLKKRK